LGVVLAAAVPATAAVAEGQRGDFVTGGGVLTELPNLTNAAGSTLAFTAFEDRNGVPDGEVQLVERSTGSTFHGKVVCVEAEVDPVTGTGTAVVGWRPRQDPNATDFERMTIFDNAQGDGEDVVTIDRGVVSNPCTAPPVTPQTSTLDGNVEIHDGD